MQNRENAINEPLIIPRVVGLRPATAAMYSSLDGCYHVYLDVGSNVGVQVRKLFQPEDYPRAKVLPVFEDFFGG